MSVNFANVTDITIPQGNVIKIHETNTGRVLWEKKSDFHINPSWGKGNASIAMPPGGGSSPIYLIARAVAGEESYHLRALFTTYPGMHPTYPNEQRFGCNLCIYFSSISYNGSSTNGAGENKTFLAVSKNWCPQPGNNQQPGLIFWYDNNNASYNFTRITEFATQPFLSRFPTITVTSKPSIPVKITVAEDRQEFLITGLADGLLILPMNFTSSTALNFDIVHANFRQTCRVSDLGLYFATSNNKQVFYSQDGKLWNRTEVFTSGSVLGVEYISKRKQLCAINGSQSQIALSTDGLTWNVKDAPFNKALAFDYSPDYELFCVVDNKAAYLTKDFSKWFSVRLPDNETVEFTDLLYFTDGIFAAHQYGSNMFYFVFTDKVYPIKEYQ